MAQQPEPRETGIKKLTDDRWEVLVSFSDRGKLKWRRRRIKGTLKDARAAQEALRTDLRRAAIVKAKALRLHRIVDKVQGAASEKVDGI